VKLSIDIQDEFLENFYNFVESMPEGAITISSSLDKEIEKRVQEYKKDRSKSIPFGNGLEEIRKKIITKI